MRRTLAVLMVAVTSMVALAFLVPLALIVRETAQNRALAEAERQASALVPVLAVTTRAEDLGHAVARTEAGRRGLLAIQVKGGATEGAFRAPAAEVAKAAAQTRASTIELPTGYALLRPVALDGDRGAVIEVFVPSADLNQGVATSWAVLTGVAVVRGSSGAGSTGLGLDIARRLAESTGGDLRVDRSSLGGAQIQLWLRTDPKP